MRRDTDRQRGFIIAYQFVRPAPPDRIVVATGLKDGAYFAYGQAYAERFRKGFELVLSETALRRLQMIQFRSPGRPLPVRTCQTYT